MKIIKIILYTLLILFISLIILLFILSLFNKSLFGFHAFKIGSGSMEPYLKVNDIVIVKEKNKYKVKDIVTYKKEDEYITHRIVKIEDKKIITKGDSNNLEDESIEKKNIIGKVIFRLRILRWISEIFLKPISLIILLIIGIIVTILWPKKKEKEV